MNSHSMLGLYVGLLFIFFSNLVSATQPLGNRSLHSLRSVNNSSNAGSLNTEVYEDKEEKSKEGIFDRMLKRKMKNHPSISPEEAKKVLRMDLLAVTAFIIGLVSLFVGPLFLSLAAVIFGIVALNNIKKEPEKKKGRGFAFIGVVFGMIRLMHVILSINR